MTIFFSDEHASKDNKDEDILYANWKRSNFI